jgi:hypothetical protein
MSCERVGVLFQIDNEPAVSDRFKPLVVNGLLGPRTGGLETAGSWGGLKTAGNRIITR